MENTPINIWMVTVKHKLEKGRISFFLSLSETVINMVNLRKKIVFSSKLQNSGKP